MAFKYRKVGKSPVFYLTLLTKTLGRQNSVQRKDIDTTLPALQTLQKNPSPHVLCKECH